jgi:hypothetical protein
MRARLYGAPLLGAAVITATVFAIGCGPPDCEGLTQEEKDAAFEEGADRAVLQCLLCNPTKETPYVDNSCGIFVSSSKGNDNNNGSRESPLRTVKRALDLLPTKPLPKLGTKSIFLCAEQFVEDVTLPSGVTVVGGLDCRAPAPATWDYNADNVETVLTAPEGKVPLRLAAGKGITVVRDAHVKAMAVSDTMPGVSSIGVIVEGVEAKFERLVIEAGSGARGADGEPYGEPATAGAPGYSGQVACKNTSAIPVEGPENMCGMVRSLGGTSGAGGTNIGTSGNSGEPHISVNGGNGETSAGAPCTGGAPGADGMASDAGADATGQGTLNGIAGYTGVSGVDGQRGAPGQGGGGGGGARSKVGNVNQCPGKMGYGASGGSGGAGGCGGAGGRGGGPGGSSIAVVSIGSKLTISASTIKAGDSGDPGDGGPGQEGGAGGAGAPGGGVPMGVNLKPACAGGTGGKGGSGGLGGRGLGGHSIGVAYIGQKPALVEDSHVTSVGNAGKGGFSAQILSF